MKNTALIYSISIISLIFIKCDSYKDESTTVLECKELRTIDGITTFNQIPYSGSCNLYVEGIKTDQKSFKMGTPHGVYKRYYYPSGNIEYSGYRRKGEIHGEYIKYHENGNIAIRGTLNNGYYKGKWSYFNENGELIKEDLWRRGKLVK